jgi:hypothetical protein
MMTFVSQNEVAPEMRILDTLFLNPEGGITLESAAKWTSYHPYARAAWCQQHGFYGLPTRELVAFLREVIGDKRALEIGSGSAELGAHLEIPMTDSGIQCTPQMRLVYEMMGQRVTEPGPRVERLCAQEAIAKYEPQMVIGSWITRRFVPGVDVEGAAQAFREGVDEEALLEQVPGYVLVGNTRSHGEKTILSHPHVRLQAPWLLSRSIYAGDNVIYLFGQSDAPWNDAHVLRGWCHQYDMTAHLGGGRF